MTYAIKYTPLQYEYLLHHVQTLFPIDSFALAVALARSVFSEGVDRRVVVIRLPANELVYSLVRSEPGDPGPVKYL